MHQAPFLLVKDPYNATSARVGACQMSLSFTFKLHEGGNARRRNTPPPSQESVETQTSVSEGTTVIAKAVKMADRYHNPDPLI